MKKHLVTILPSGNTGKAKHQSRLIEALEGYEMEVHTPCGGMGTCGSCRVKVVSGNLEMPSTPHLTPDEVEEGWVLACQAKVVSDCKIEIPKEKIEDQIPQGELFKLQVEKISPLKTIDGQKNLAIAIDLGTTTIVISLLDISDGKILASASDYNGQSRRGYDVINRIVWCEREGGEELKALALKTINKLIETVLKKAGTLSSQITSVFVAGNTTMIYLFLGRDPTDIRTVPAMPIEVSFPNILASSVGLNVNPEALVGIVPGVANYLGGDVVGGILATRLYKDSKLSLFLDIGTNGETIIGNREWMMGCACSAGPAFEGMGIANGMRATIGAIQSIKLERKNLKPNLNVIGGGRPVGMCGTAMIDILSELYQNHLIDERTNFISPSKAKGFIKSSYGWRYLVAPEKATRNAREITISEGDLDTIVRTKAAIYAGIDTMLGHLGLKPLDIERVYVAGAFGQALDIRQAISIGMLPNLPLDRFNYVGNTSLIGAQLGCLSEEARKTMADIARKITYLDLSGSNQFVEAFTAASFIPHTRKELFVGEKK